MSRVTARAKMGTPSDKSENAPHDRECSFCGKKGHELIYCPLRNKMIMHMNSSQIEQKNARARKTSASNSNDGDAGAAGSGGAGAGAGAGKKATRKDKKVNKLKK